MSDINATAREIHEWAVSKGWWDDRIKPDYNGETGEDIEPPTNQTLAMLMLVNTELAEAAEAVRKHDVNATWVDEETNSPEGFPVEIADAVIRLFDLAHGYGIDLAEEIEHKMAYNQKRPYRHGKKRA